MQGCVSRRYPLNREFAQTFVCSLKVPEFQAEYRQARRDAYAHVARLQKACGAAVSSLLMSCWIVSLWDILPVYKPQRYKYMAVNQKGQGSKPVC
jgi:hypothetical protein